MNRRELILCGASVATGTAFATVHNVPLAPPSEASLVVDGGFEAQLGGQNAWKPFQHAGERAYYFGRDSAHKVEGTQSLIIRQLRPQVFGAVRQSIMRPEKGRYIASAMMRSNDVIGKGWGLALVAVSFDGQILSAASRPLTGDIDWSHCECSLPITSDIAVLDITFELYAERGTGWVDRAFLTRRDA